MANSYQKMEGFHDEYLSNEMEACCLKGSAFIQKKCNLYIVDLFHLKEVGVYVEGC